MINFNTGLGNPVVGGLYIGNISKDRLFYDHTMFNEYKHVMEKALNYSIEVKISCIQDYDTTEIPADFIDLIQRMEEYYDLDSNNFFVFISNDFNRMHKRKEVAKKMKNWLRNYIKSSSRLQFSEKIYFLEISGEVTTIYDYYSFENKVIK